MHPDRNSTVWKSSNFLGLYGWRNRSPLPDPIISYRRFSVEPSALPSVRPIYLRMHESKDRLHITGIELVVHIRQELSEIVHHTILRKI